MTNDNFYFVIYFNVIFIQFFFVGEGGRRKGLRVKLNENIVHFFYLKN